MSYILQRFPKFTDGTVTIKGTTYNLKMVDTYGGVFTISKDGVPQEEITLSIATMEGFFALLNTNL